MNILLFDDNTWDELLPLTFTKPVAELRVGILTIREKWEKITGEKISFITKPYLSEKYCYVTENDNILINSRLLPDPDLAMKVMSAGFGSSAKCGSILLYARVGKSQATDFINTRSLGLTNESNIAELPECLNSCCDIFRKNGSEIQKDFVLLTRGRKTQKLCESNNIINAGGVFAENGVQAQFVTINASSGPVYLGENAEIMEGSVIRGPFALCNNSTVKLAAKIYGPTTVGPHSKVGGEINNSVISGYSNKAHDGFLGNSVIGEWCNLGADTNNSNLKNNYADVKMWNFPKKQFVKTGLTFAGLIMGDHTKCGINTMFNTGTVAGVSSNLFGSGFHRNYIPSFSWGGPAGYTTFELEKAIEVARKIMSRRNIELSKNDYNILKWIFENHNNY